jgi:anti-anti-sigma regulatory factor
MENQAQIFNLPPVMTIETADAVAAELKQLVITDKTHLTLDVSKVEQITTPGLQLMVSLEKSLTQHGGVLTIVGSQPLFTRTLHDIGCEHLLTPAT